MAGVYVLHHGGDGGAALFQLAAKIARGGKLLAVSNDGDQQFAGGVPYAYNGVTNEACVGVFVIGLHVVALHERPNSQNRLLGVFVFQEAGIGVDDAVRASCVHAAKDFVLRCALGAGIALLAPRLLSAFSLPSWNIGRSDLVAVVIGFVHPCNGVEHGALACERLEEFNHLVLLAFQLFLVRKGKQLAGSALLLRRAVGHVHGRGSFKCVHVRSVADAARLLGGFDT